MASLQTVIYNSNQFNFYADSDILVKVTMANVTVFLTTEGEAFDYLGRPYFSEVRLHGDDYLGCEVRICVKGRLADVYFDGELIKRGGSFKGCVSLLSGLMINWLNVEIIC